MLHLSVANIVSTHVGFVCVSPVWVAPLVWVAASASALCVGRPLCGRPLCVGRSLVGPSPLVSDPRYVDIRSRDGSRTSARSHGGLLLFGKISQIHMLLLLLFIKIVTSNIKHQTSNKSSCLISLYLRYR